MASLPPAALFLAQGGPGLFLPFLLFANALYYRRTEAGFGPGMWTGPVACLRLMGLCATLGTLFILVQGACAVAGTCSENTKQAFFFLPMTVLPLMRMSLLLVISRTWRLGRYLAVILPLLITGGFLLSNLLYPRDPAAQVALAWLPYMV
jgi:hypothetical protein